MKHEKRVRKEGSKKALNKQAERWGATASIDQSKWWRGLAVNLKRTQAVMDGIISHACQAESVPLLKQIPALVKKASLGFAKTKVCPTGTKIVLEGRWLEEAGFRPGGFVRVEVRGGGRIELVYAGGER